MLSEPRSHTGVHLRQHFLAGLEAKGVFHVQHPVAPELAQNLILQAGLRPQELYQIPELFNV